MRTIRVAAAQLGPIQKAERREAVVARMIALLDQANAAGADLIVYPELALTTFFPRWYMTDQAEVDAWFEREMPNAATRPLFERAAQYGIGMTFGYAELTPDGHRFNTSILVDPANRRQVPQGASARPREFDPERAFQHLEKRYFEPGNLGFNVWRTMGGIVGMCICNDRRWPETYRVLGLQGVEMVLLGYNTPSINSAEDRRGPESGCSTTALGCRPAPIRIRPGWWRRQGRRRGRHPLIGGSVIVDPDGEIVAEARRERTSWWSTAAISTPRRSARRRSSTSRATGASSTTAGSPAAPARCRRRKTRCPASAFVTENQLANCTVPSAMVTAACVGSITGIPSACSSGLR